LGGFAGLLYWGTRRGLICSVGSTQKKRERCPKNPATTGQKMLCNQRALPPLNSLSELKPKGGDSGLGTVDSVVLGKMANPDMKGEKTGQLLTEYPQKKTRIRGIAAVFDQKKKMQGVGDCHDHVQTEEAGKILEKNSDGRTEKRRKALLHE